MSNWINWAAFAFFTVGAVGGIMFIVEHVMYKLRSKRNEYDPWEVQAPASTHREPPISGRCE
jgi:hypothetical protein